MIRYKDVLLKISNVCHESAITSLRNGLRHDSKLKLEMTVNRPLMLKDAIHKAANYAKAEEEFASYEM